MFRRCCSPALAGPVPAKAGAGAGRDSAGNVPHDLTHFVEGSAPPPTPLPSRKQRGSGGPLLSRVRFAVLF
jgi:hypothetical protein